MVLPLLLLAGKLLLGAAAATSVAVAIFIISYRDIVRNLQQHKLHDKDIGELVKEHLKNGNVRVVGSVWSKRSLGIFPRQLQHQEVFEGKLDSELEHIFARQDRVQITI
jgi:hypothetical protein